MDLQKNQGTIFINGDVTLNESIKIKELLSQAINNANKIIIDMKNVSYLDLSFFQLLFAAQKKAKALQKAIFFEDSSLEFIKSSVHEAGFSRAIMVHAR
jgi:anti-anti-sigma factor